MLAFRATGSLNVSARSPRIQRGAHSFADPPAAVALPSRTPSHATRPHPTPARCDRTFSARVARQQLNPLRRSSKRSARRPVVEGQPSSGASLEQTPRGVLACLREASLGVSALGRALTGTVALALTITQRNRELRREALRLSVACRVCSRQVTERGLKLRRGTHCCARCLQRGRLVAGSPLRCLLRCLAFAPIISPGGMPSRPRVM